MSREPDSWLDYYLTCICSTGGVPNTNAMFSTWFLESILSVSCVLLFHFTKYLSVTHTVMSVTHTVMSVTHMVMSVTNTDMSVHSPLIIQHMSGNHAVIMCFNSLHTPNASAWSNSGDDLSLPDNFLQQFFSPCDVCLHNQSRCDRS